MGLHRPFLRALWVAALLLVALCAPAGATLPAAATHSAQPGRAALGTRPSHVLEDAGASAATPADAAPTADAVDVPGARSLLQTGRRKHTQSGLNRGTVRHTQATSLKNPAVRRAALAGLAAQVKADTAAVEKRLAGMQQHAKKSAQEEAEMGLGRRLLRQRPAQQGQRE